MFSNTCAMTLAQKSDRILAQTRGLSGATPNATQLIEKLRWALEENRREVERLTTERDEARREVCARTLSEQAIMGFEKSTLEAIAAARSWDCLGPAELAKAVQTELYKGQG